MEGAHHRKGLRITAKLILWFLFAALLPMAIATYISYSRSQRFLKEEAANRLVAVTDSNINRIVSYLGEKTEKVHMLSHMSDIIEAVEQLEVASGEGAESAAYREALNEYSPFLLYYQQSFGYEALFLIDPDGDIIFSTEDKADSRSLYEVALYENSALAKTFIRAAKSRQMEISDFRYYPDTRKVSAYIVAPVLKGLELVGLVGVAMNSGGIYELIKDYAGLGETGETLIASASGDELIFITPLRFDPYAPFGKGIKMGSDDAQDIQMAVQAKETLDTFVDYRGRQVLAVTRYIPSFRLGISVKMDTEEIFASAAHLRDDLTRISLALLLVVILMAFFIASSISGPIKGLTKVSTTIAGGDLSARADVKTADEIGELADSFNKMTDGLVEAKASVEEKKNQLEEQKALLEEANRELDSFVYTVSHDLRAPLRGVDAFAGFTEKDYAGKLDDKGRDYLGRIRAGVRKMSQLIDDLLALSRISRIKNPFEDTDISALIKSVVERISYDISEKKVELIISKDLPVVRCDPIKMEEVFLNLMTNAIKFSSKNNKKRPRVEIGYIDKPDVHEFFVKDNGIGIDKKYHQKVFGIFQRLHKEEEYEGTGAGLSIVKKVIDDHKGRIWVESEPGEGAEFHFTIPKREIKRKRLGEILVADKAISEEDLKNALKKQGLGNKGDDDEPPKV